MIMDTPRGLADPFVEWYTVGKNLFQYGEIARSKMCLLNECLVSLKTVRLVAACASFQVYLGPSRSMRTRSLPPWPWFMGRKGGNQEREKKKRGPCGEGRLAGRRERKKEKEKVFRSHL